MNNDWFKLSRKNAKVILIYLSIMLLIGIALSLFTILNKSLALELPIIVLSILGGCGMALIGSSINYLRKIYKSSIQLLMAEPENENDKKRELGIIAYYLLRPIFAICFSILLFVCIKTGVGIITIKQTSLDDGMIYLIMFLSFFVGFGSGDMLTKLDSYSKEVVNKVFKQTEGS